MKKLCLVKVLYWETWQLTNKKSKHLECNDCPFRDKCVDELKGEEK